MKLNELLKAIETPPSSLVSTILNPEVLEANAHRTVVSITSDSRKVRSGSLFVCLVGTLTDGHQYIAKAVEAGALAIVVEKNRTFNLDLVKNTPVISVDSSYLAIALLSSHFSGNPGAQLRMVGVTGTNGKTTVTHLIQKMLEDAEHRVGLIGTLGHRSQGTQNYDSTGHTTPMATELQPILADMIREKTEFVVMEVSSHALDQYRVAGCEFEVAAFTNLTQDHLDFHKTMEHYCQAKTKLFSALNPSLGNRYAVINLDDPSAEKFVKATPPGIHLYTYAIDAENASIRATDLKFNITGASFQVSTPKGNAGVNLKLAGKFSIYNALCALASGLALGIPLDHCITSLESVEGVRGRFEIVSQNPFVIVDYAHTPDGLENILSAARLVLPQGGRLIGVFGCGGDRDATKRPKMGAIAENLADILVVTSDNPRTEEPQQILTDILSGIKRFESHRMIVNPDREQAIHQAIDLAQPNDVIVVAGKGHEDYQILADRVIHFDDKEVVQAYVKGKALQNQPLPSSP
ncbi:MAG: UDP-N-acetylmuramoyl-L-alanyl-D-glutamate--2,6-diaminopimelate ligase [Cyanobacteria bacterium]|nr:UDP-N-acetylmuramoyl-L-alanyl-D-glutamate--2,6-diaminopimelate ligase [Cyanobacteriota bacterium]